MNKYFFISSMYDAFCSVLRGLKRISFDFWLDSSLSLYRIVWFNFEWMNRFHERNKYINWVRDRLKQKYRSKTVHWSGTVIRRHFWVTQRIFGDANFVRRNFCVMQLLFDAAPCDVTLGDVTLGDVTLCDVTLCDVTFVWRKFWVTLEFSSMQLLCDANFLWISFKQMCAKVREHLKIITFLSIAIKQCLYHAFKIHISDNR
jgi:hypothetical protein